MVTSRIVVSGAPIALLRTARGAAGSDTGVVGDRHLSILMLTLGLDRALILRLLLVHLFVVAKVLDRLVSLLVMAGFLDRLVHLLVMASVLH